MIENPVSGLLVSRFNTSKFFSMGYNKEKIKYMSGFVYFGVWYELHQEYEGRNKIYRPEIDSDMVAVQNIYNSSVYILLALKKTKISFTLISFLFV